MKKIEAVFMPHKLDDVRNAMGELGLEKFVVSELSAHEPELNNGSWGREWHPDFRPRLKLEVLVKNETATEAARAILHAARTRHPLESEVTIATVEEAVEIGDDQAPAKHAENSPVTAHA
jgi:nitrogen regulatory protein PII